MSREGCQKLVRGQGGGAEFADDDAAGVIRDFCGIGQLETGCESQSEQRDRGVAGAGDVVNLASTRVNVMRALSALEEHHAVLAKGDEHAVHGPFFEEDAADFTEVKLDPDALNEGGKNGNWPGWTLPSIGPWPDRAGWR